KEPVETPTEKKPVVAPTEKEPVEAPTQKELVAVPTQKEPVEAATEEKPVVVPTEKDAPSKEESPVKDSTEKKSYKRTDTKIKLLQFLENKEEYKKQPLVTMTPGRKFRDSWIKPREEPVRKEPKNILAEIQVNQ